MKTYITIYQGEDAKKARPLLATADRGVIEETARALRRRLAGPAKQGNDGSEDQPESVPETESQR